MTVGAPAAQLCAWTSYSADPNPINNQSCNMLNAPTTTGVNEQALSKIVIYPNPTTGKLYLENLPKEAVFVNILDVNGKFGQLHMGVSLVIRVHSLKHLSHDIYFVQFGKTWFNNE